MLKRFLQVSVAGFAIFATLSLADSAKRIPLPDKADTIVVPVGSTLHFRAFDTENTATFDGAIELSGIYYYGDNPLDDGTIERTLTLVPDAATKARMPHYKERGIPDSIWIDGADGFAKAVVSKDQLTALHKKNAKQLSGHIDMMADGFTMGIECDAPNMSAHFLSVVKPPMHLASKDQPDTGC